MVKKKFEKRQSSNGRLINTEALMAANSDLRLRN